MPSLGSLGAGIVIGWLSALVLRAAANILEVITFTFTFLLSYSLLPALFWGLNSNTIRLQAAVAGGTIVGFAGYHALCMWLANRIQRRGVAGANPASGEGGYEWIGGRRH